MKGTDGKKGDKGDPVRLYSPPSLSLALIDEQDYYFSWLTLSDHSSLPLTMSYYHKLLLSCDFVISILICSVIKFGFLCVPHFIAPTIFPLGSRHGLCLTVCSFRF